MSIALPYVLCKELTVREILDRNKNGTMYRFEAFNCMLQNQPCAQSTPRDRRATAVTSCMLRTQVRPMTHILGDKEEILDTQKNVADQPKCNIYLMRRMLAIAMVCTIAPFAKHELIGVTSSSANLYKTKYMIIETLN